MKLIHPFLLSLSFHQHSSQYCPSLLLGDLGLMLGGQILLPPSAAGSSGGNRSGGSGGGGKEGPKVQGDFASGGSHMLASEPQSSAHSEVTEKEKKSNF